MRTVKICNSEASTNQHGTAHHLTPLPSHFRAEADFNICPEGCNVGQLIWKLKIEKVCMELEVLVEFGASALVYKDEPVCFREYKSSALRPGSSHQTSSSSITFEQLLYLRL